MFIWWTSETKAVPVRPDGMGGCSVCRCERPFSLFVQYRSTRLYSTFGRVSGREYLRLCDVCGHGQVTPVSVATVEAGDAAIPYLERQGCRGFFLIFVACLLFALVVGSL